MMTLSRTQKQAQWKLTPESKAKIPAWNEKWVDVITSTKGMDDREREIARKAIHGMYEAAGLPHKDLKIVFVPSPLMAAVVAGAAAAWWYKQENSVLVAQKHVDATRAATVAATAAATRAATAAATDAATRDATRDATRAATAAATDAATRDATDAATRAATDAATRDATVDATVAATVDATRAATDDATRAATDAATRAATVAATAAATRAATAAATDDATRAATDDATDAATAAATDAATVAATAAATAAATSDATAAATDAATRDATRDATVDATVAATVDATVAATRAATDDATDDATVAATRYFEEEHHFATMLRAAFSVVGDDPFTRMCIERSWYMRQGGNHWASWCCYLSFVRDVVGFRHPSHEKYVHYEDAAKHSSWRYMHPKFCVVSDRPAALKTEMLNGRMRLHCEDGPALAWRDGWSIWYIHGVRVTEQIVMRPETQTIAEIRKEANEEVRRIRIERYGWDRYITETGAKVVNKRKNERDGQVETLYRLDDKSLRIVLTDPSTGRRYALGVPRSIETCEQAQAWMSHDLDSLAIHRS